MFDLIKYMKAVAENLPEVGHDDNDPEKKRFHRATGIAQIEELLNSNTEGFNIVAIDSIDSRFMDTGSNTLDEPFFTFMVLKNCTHNDFDAVHQAKIDCKKIVQKIRAKMLYDRANMQNGLEELRTRNISIFTVGPMADYFFGAAMNFTLYEQANTCHNPDEWTNDFTGINPSAWTTEQNEQNS